MGSDIAIDNTPRLRPCFHWLIGDSILTPVDFEAGHDDFQTLLDRMLPWQLKQLPSPFMLREGDRSLQTQLLAYKPLDTVYQTVALNTTFQDHNQEGSP
jgi:hypothetical protein